MVRLAVSLGVLSELPHGSDSSFMPVNDLLTVAGSECLRWLEVACT